jgi:hypothetical protein
MTSLSARSRSVTVRCDRSRRSESPVISPPARRISRGHIAAAGSPISQETETRSRAHKKCGPSQEVRRSQPVAHTLGRWHPIPQTGPMALTRSLFTQHLLPRPCDFAALCARWCVRAIPTRMVRVRPMLHSADQNNLLVFEDFVDDAIVVTPCRVGSDLPFVRGAKRLRLAEAQRSYVPRYE